MTAAPRHIAQMNYGRLKYGWEDPRTAPFADALEMIYAVAERSPGFVWMMSEGDMDAEQRSADGVFAGDPMIASTLSVWESEDALRDFVWNTLHGAYLARGAEWFERIEGPKLVLWPVAIGHRPTMREAMERMRRLAEHGPGPEAFGLEPPENWRRS